MINEKAFKEYEKELCECGDYLPNIIRGLLSKEYIINLMDNDKYENVLKKIDSTRSYTYEESINELKKWVKDNPKYKDILIKRR